ncbi:hypothetical protein GCM10011491_14010 [Brucella endophytica]|uniref:Uncharacterized protein n=1 Tax=Brucella endophytica TaxID=1963359 RepID=A0A916S6V4_9HYPH|nr:hypothetical protein GCM10011491_14010 [Brucella endophytica]
MGAEAQFRLCGDEADEPAAIGEKPARQIVDLIAEFRRRAHHLLARLGGDARARREGAGDCGTGNPRPFGHLLGADETTLLCR